MTNLMTPISVLREEVEAGLVGLRVSDYPMVNLLTKRPAYQDNIKWQVNISTVGASAVAAAAAAPAASSDTVVGASLACGSARFSHTIRLMNNDVVQAARIGTAPLRDLFRSHVNAGLDRIMKSIETNIFAGTGNTASGGIVGLGQAVAATGAYAGLNPATSGQEAWSAFAASVAAANWGETALSGVKTGIMKKGGNFSAIVCDMDMLQLYEQAYIASGKPNVLSVQAQQLASLGYNVYEYAGRPIIGDIYAPANTMYFLDMSQMGLYTRATEETQVINGMNVVIGEIASDTATAKVYEIAVYPQLVLLDRKSAGILTYVPA